MGEKDSKPLRRLDERLALLRQAVGGIADADDQELFHRRLSRA
jgi:hypothetical protein